MYVSIPSFKLLPKSYISRVATVTTVSLHKMLTLIQSQGVPAQNSTEQVTRLFSCPNIK